MINNLTPSESLDLLQQIDAENSLYSFVKLLWPIVEPANPFVGNWHIEAITEHLQAVTAGKINRLLINIPPGCMKSLLTCVFWPAWEWLQKPHMRYICTSYSQSLTERDNIRFRQLITSDIYRKLWGARFSPSKDTFSVIKVANDKTGWKLATSVGGVGTGERGDRIAIDDPHNVREGESEAVMDSTLQYFSEVIPTRLTNPINSAIVVIMQRVNDGDVAGYILANELGYEKLILPMEYDKTRHCRTSIGFSDPRKKEGELIFSARFPRFVVDRDKKIMGSFATAAQFQQLPAPRGGGIFKRDWFQLYPANKPFPKLEMVIQSYDTAHTANTNNDPTAFTAWGIFKISEKLGFGAMLLDCWSEHMEYPDLRKKAKREYLTRYGTDEYERRVDLVVIEDKASGITLRQDLIRAGVPVFKYNPGRADKVQRAHVVSSLVESGLIFLPESDKNEGQPYQWTRWLIDQLCTFPKGKRDDGVDSCTQAWHLLKDQTWLSIDPDDDDDTEDNVLKPLNPYAQ